MKLKVLVILLTTCSFSALASQDIKLDIEVIEYRPLGSTLLVKEGCEFRGYQKYKSESVFLAECGNKLANYKVQNSEWDVIGFNVEQGVNMKVPLKLTGQSVGWDFEKVAELLPNN